jgi:hypothetical protein
MLEELIPLKRKINPFVLQKFTPNLEPLKSGCSASHVIDGIMLSLVVVPVIAYST